MAEGQTQQFAGYEILSTLGQGGMGVVFKARDTALDRLVAIKVLASHLAADSDYLARFKREAIAAASMSHPNLVHVYQAGESDGIHYFAMEFIEGESLQKRLDRSGRLDPEEAVAVCVYVAQALDHAWKKSQIIHRDIKPDNIFLTHDGIVKVGDLGLAKSMRSSGTSASLTQTGMTLGTPHYISPEQARGRKDLDFRADIYSLGCTLYRMLSGQTPYQGDEALEIILHHVNDPPPDILKLLPTCPRPLVSLLARMMAKNPNTRHASYAELIAELQQVDAQIKGGTVAAPRVVSRGVALQSRTSRYAVAAVVGVSALVGVWMWAPWKLGETPKPPTADEPKTDQLKPPPVATPDKLQSGNAFAKPPELTASRPLAKVITNSIGMKLTLIPAGKFMMGAPESETGRLAREGPVHEVRISKPFYMGIHEVTVGNFRRFVQAAHYRTEAETNGKSAVREAQSGNGNNDVNCNWQSAGWEQSEDYPVVAVSWADVAAFCRWLSEQEGRIYRLPTEAEWEYACRAGTTTPFNVGVSLASTQANFKGTTPYGQATSEPYLRRATRVGSYAPNAFGLFDMHGNVAELCSDWRDESYYAVSPANDPQGPSGGDRYAVRGGAWIGPSDGCRSAMRYNMRPGTSYNTIGFRIVREVPSADLAAVKAAEQPPQPGQPLMTSIGMELVYIPPGEFMMGSTAEAQTWALANGAAREKVKYEGEQPRRAMIRHAFWLGRTEVTVKQWKQFVDATGYKTDAEKSDRTTWRAPRPDYRLADNDPVRCMSWNDAMAFCAWLNEREQAGERLPPGCQMRLPTEAEWECACRAGTQTKFWWGDSEQDAAGRCNLRGTADGFEFVSPVDHYGARGRNPVGLADMLGNVWEYCLDAFDAKGAHEELFADSSGYKVWRGGAFTNPACYTRCASRDAYIPNMSWSDHGFRVCCGVEPTKATVKVTVKDETQPATNAVVNLLPLIDPKADTISGIWTLRNCELISEGSGEGRRIEVPYQPPDEYDLCAVFTRITGKAGHVQILSQAGRCFQWWVGGSAESILVSGAILVIVHLRFSREDWRLDADIAPWSKFARTALERFWTASSLCNGMVTLRVGR